MRFTMAFVLLITLWSWSFPEVRFKVSHMGWQDKRMGQPHAYVLLIHFISPLVLIHTVVLPNHDDICIRCINKLKVRSMAGFRLSLIMGLKTGLKYGIRQ